MPQADGLPMLTKQEQIQVVSLFLCAQAQAIVTSDSLNSPNDHLPCQFKDDLDKLPDLVEGDPDDGLEDADSDCSFISNPHNHQELLQALDGAMLDNAKLDELLRVLCDEMLDNAKLYELLVVLCQAMSDNDKFNDKFFFATIAWNNSSVESWLQFAPFLFLLVSAEAGCPPRGKESTILYVNAELLPRNIFITANRPSN